MALAAVRRYVLAAGDPAAAYARFVDGIGTWWPVEEFGDFGAGARVDFDGTRFVETGADGRTQSWGTIMHADPPREVGFTWHPGRPPESAGRIRVAFTPVAAGVTLVELEHDGWEAHDDPAAARAGYDAGWYGLLAAFVGPAPSDADAIWFVLEHTAAGGVAGRVFEHPDFALHAEFLGTLADHGALVAAGPLPDAPGTGMTIVRAQDAPTAREVIEAAQREDGAVTSGLLEVRIRPWHVVMSAG